MLILGNNKLPINMHKQNKVVVKRIGRKNICELRTLYSSESVTTANKKKGWRPLHPQNFQFES